MVQNDITRRSKIWISQEGPEFVEEAAKAFEGYAVNIVTGHKLLGGFIGDELETEKWLQQKSTFG